MIEFDNLHEVIQKFGCNEERAKDIAERVTTLLNAVNREGDRDFYDLITLKANKIENVPATLGTIHIVVQHKFRDNHGGMIVDIPKYKMYRVFVRSEEHGCDFDMNTEVNNLYAHEMMDYMYNNSLE